MKQTVSALVKESGQILLSKFEEVEGNPDIGDKYAHFLRTARQQQQQQQQQHQEQQQAFVQAIELMKPEQFTAAGTAEIKILVEQWREELAAQLRMVE